MKTILKCSLVRAIKNNVEISKLFMLCIIFSACSLQIFCRVSRLVPMPTMHSKALKTVVGSRNKSLNAGIIGGLGPDTTAEFYKKIVSSYQEKSQNEKPSILISSVAIPYAVEQNFILQNQGIELYVPFLIRAAMQLEKAGADFLAMPCNSLHALIDEISRSVKIPVVSIVHETMRFLKKNNFSNVALISTLATMTNKLYEKVFDQNNIAYAKLNKQEQAQIGNIISNLVRGKIIKKDRARLEKIIHNTGNQQVDCVVLACTDLQLLQPKHPDLKIIDTMHILAEAVVTRLL